MKRRWAGATVAMLGVWALSAPVAWAQDTAQKAAVAEWIVDREQAAAGRPFDPDFRTAVAKGLAALPWPTLQTQIQQSGLGTYILGDSQADLVFTPVTPCRILDTRLAGGPLAANTTRDFLVTGDTTAQEGASCGIPFGPATAAVLNFVAVNPAGPGDLRVTPFGTPMPLASIVNYAAVAGLNIANGLVVTLCDPAATTCPSDITIQADVSGTDVVADVQGYFRKVRKEQVRSFVVTARSDTSTSIGSSCTHHTNAEVTVVAPVAGRILVRINAVVNFNHTLGNLDEVHLFVGTSPTDCSQPLGHAVKYGLSGVINTTVQARTVIPLFGVFDVTPGTYTYFLNGLMAFGDDGDDKFEFSGVEATFFPA